MSNNTENEPELQNGALKLYNKLIAHVNYKIKETELIFGFFVGIITILSFIVATHWFLFTVKVEVDNRYPEHKKPKAKQNSLYKAAEFFVKI